MARQPNLLVIMSDQHSPHVLGCYGDPIVRTPNFDSLADRGVRFESTYCGNPLCVPSRMTFLTSRHGYQIQSWTNGCELRTDVATYNHHLVNQGYHTVLCGRMHFIGDQRHGFETRIIGDVDPNLEHIPQVTTGQSAEGVETAGPGRSAYICYDDAVTERACRFLEDQDAGDEDRPFAMTVGYVLPHCPYIAPLDLYEEYYEAVDVPQLPEGYLDDLHPAMSQWRETRKVASLTDEQVRVARAAYYGLVTYCDDLVGQILSTLSQTRFAEDTVVVYTSDHGEMAGEHRMWWKSSFYEGSVSVPLIMSWPGRFAEGRSVPAVTSLLDIGPTLVDIAGGSMNHVAGRSLRGFCEGDGAVSDWPDTAFSEYAGLQGDRPARMIRRGDWKLNHYHGFDRPQLFNLAQDPQEYQDRAGDPACADVRQELHEAVLAGWDGDYLEAYLQRMDADRAVMRQFRGNATISRDDPPDRWTAPDGCNIFPQTRE